MSEHAPASLAKEIADVLSRDLATVARLADVQRRHEARRAGKSEFPAFPIEPTTDLLVDA